MKTIFSIIAMLLASIAAAQDMNAIKYSRFSDPIIPFFRYQDLSLNKQPIKVEEQTDVMNNKDNVWKKREHIVYDFNKAGFITTKTETKTDTPKEIVTSKTVHLFSYQNEKPLKVLTTKSGVFKNKDEVEVLDFVFGADGTTKLIKNKDTLTIQGNLLGGKKYQVSYNESGKILETVYTDKSILGFTSIYNTVAYGDNLLPALRFKSDGKTIAIYLPEDPTFYWSYYSATAQADYEMLKNELKKGQENFKALIAQASYFNRQTPKGLGHIKFKRSSASNWIAIYNKKNSSYNSTSITMRKISYTDTSVEGSLEIDKEFAALHK
jgi:hypothetical protein